MPVLPASKFTTTRAYTVTQLILEVYKTASSH